MILPIAGFAVLAAASAAVWAFVRETQAPVDRLQIVEEYPHDPSAFTQGLVIRGGVMHESTGLYGRSSVRHVELKTGQIERIVSLDDQIFGEGIAILGDELFLLTWKNRVGYVFDRKTLEFKRAFHYGGEGWGLTSDGTHLILSDGTAVLKFLDPKDARVVKKLPVRDGGTLVDNLNELEYVDGEIYANVWYSDRIARISPKTGELLGWLDASVLRKQVELNNPREDVLNGIAWDRETKKLYVTGKRWPKLFEVEIAR
ncbi:MAG: glutaminyl-peptide cyclotransferase [Planctomycetaceae bacterium]